MNILLWHVHGSWTNAFVHGRHRVLLPVLADRGPFGRGRARTWTWPSNAVEVTPQALRDEPIDVVIVQRPEEEHLARGWLGGRIPGVDLPLLWLEHNAPQGAINAMRHPAADRHDVRVVHVTPTNQLFWDCGTTPTTVIEHGVVDPGHRYRGDQARAAIVVNEPVRRGRVAGTDLLDRFAATAPLDLFGMGVTDLARHMADAGRPVRGFEDLPQHRLHDELPQRRVYIHPYRWTSLGLALIEAMLLGLPVVALAVTDAPDAVPPGAGIVSNRLDRLTEAVAGYLGDRAAAAEAGSLARAAALQRFGLGRFLRDWDVLLERSVAEHPTRRTHRGNGTPTRHDGPHGEVRPSQHPAPIRSWR